MKNLFTIFSTNTIKPKNLKEFLGLEIKDQLVNLEYPNVGNYRVGSRTSKKEEFKETYSM